ncbi:MAG: gamma-glutamylcyclotransferase family protein [Candidatus Saliniplasma sp.]
MDSLFTYGTLRYEDEEPNFGIDLNKYIEETKNGIVEGDLYVVEGFPFLDPDGDGEVKGKMFVLSDIERVLDKYDRIEGAQDPEPFFKREVVDVELEDGSVEKAYCYIGGDNLRKCFGKPEYKVEECNWDKIKNKWE